MRALKRVALLLFVLLAGVAGGLTVDDVLTDLSHRHAQLIVPARAATLSDVCGPIDEMAAMAKREWGEEPWFYGVTGRGLAIAILVSPRGTSWSALQGPTDGPACIVAQGAAWMGRGRPTN